MAKYYVRSGELEKIVIADDPVEAARKSILLTCGETVGSRFFVDERGFRGPREHLNECGVKVGEQPSYSFTYEYIVQDSLD